MTKITLITMTLIITGLLFQSCDPTYSIRIQNSTSDTLTVVARTTIRFHMENIDYNVLSRTFNDDEWIRFTIPPMGYADCGNAIGGLENDLPFKELKIYMERDSIVATSETEVLSLFKTKLIGGFRTPYTIEIK